MILFSPDFHNVGNRLDMVELDGNHHLSRAYTERDPIRVKRIFEWANRNGKACFLLRFYHGYRPRPSAAVMDWMQSYLYERTNSGSSEDEIWMVNYPKKSLAIRNMASIFGLERIKLARLHVDVKENVTLEMVDLNEALQHHLRTYSNDIFTIYSSVL